MRRLLILFAAFHSCLGAIVAEEPVVQPPMMMDIPYLPMAPDEAQRTRTSFEERLVRIAELSGGIWKKHWLPVLGPLGAGELTKSQRPGWKEFYTFNKGGCFLRCDAAGRLTDASAAPTHETAKTYSAPDQPTWTEDKARQIASEFVFAALGRLPVDYAKPVLFFDNKKRAGEFREGQWIVTWKRVSAEGFPFFENDVTVYLNESTGPTSLDAPSYETFAPIAFKPIPLSAAMTHAEQSFKIANEDGMARKSTPPKGELVVVKPNGAGRNPAPDKEEPPRLAWAVAFPWELKTEKGAVYREGSYFAWIDAENGQPLGGNWDSHFLPLKP